MSYNFKVGTEIARGFKIIATKNKSITLDPDHPIVDFTEVQLDCLYENLAILSLVTYLKSPPPFEEWARLALTGTEKLHHPWKLRKIVQPYISVAFKKRGQLGHLIAVTEIITAKGQTLIASQLQWYGLPLVNRFTVGFKPGMKERTEELLLAGLNFVK